MVTAVTVHSLRPTRRTRSRDRTSMCDRPPHVRPPLRSALVIAHRPRSCALYCQPSGHPGCHQCHPATYRRAVCLHQAPGLRPSVCPPSMVPSGFTFTAPHSRLQGPATSPPQAHKAYFPPTWLDSRDLSPFSSATMMLQLQRSCKALPILWYFIPAN